MKIYSRFLLLSLFGVLAFGIEAAAQQNPFLRSSPAPAAVADSSSPDSSATVEPSNTTAPQYAPPPLGRQGRAYGTLPSPFLAEIISWQRALRTRLSAAIRAIQKEDGSGHFWLFLALCFTYGIVHALGPGHGKAVVGSYFMSRQGTWKQAVFMSTTTTFIHVLSAVLLLYGLHYLAVQSVFSTFEEQRVQMESLSYGLLGLTGLTLLGISLWHWIRPKRQAAVSPPAEKATTRSILTMAAVTGLAPCPAVALVSLFCLSQGAAALGLAGAAAIGLGMALTTAAFGVAFVGFRRGLSRAISPWKRYAHIMHHLLETGGALAITTLGALLWYGARF